MAYIELTQPFWRERARISEIKRLTLDQIRTQLDDQSLAHFDALFLTFSGGKGGKPLSRLPIWEHAVPAILTGARAFCSYPTPVIDITRRSISFAENLSPRISPYDVAVFQAFDQLLREYPQLKIHVIAHSCGANIIRKVLRYAKGEMTRHSDHQELRVRWDRFSAILFGTLNVLYSPENDWIIKEHALFISHPKDATYWGSWEALLLLGLRSVKMSVLNTSFDAEFSDHHCNFVSDVWGKEVFRRIVDFQAEKLIHF